MPRIKYVLMDDATFGIISEHSGMVHTDLANLLKTDDNAVVSAGFLSLDMATGTIETHGESQSLSVALYTTVRARQEDGPLIEDRLRQGQETHEQEIGAEFRVATADCWLLTNSPEPRRQLDQRFTEKANYFASLGLDKEEALPPSQPMDMAALLDPKVMRHYQPVPRFSG